MRKDQKRAQALKIAEAGFPGKGLEVSVTRKWVN